MCQLCCACFDAQVILACGSAVDAMVQSGVARYLEFKTLGAVFIAQQQQVRTNCHMTTFQRSVMQCVIRMCKHCVTHESIRGCHISDALRLQLLSICETTVLLSDWVLVAVYTAFICQVCASIVA
jgi:hypothetical protein